MQESPAAQGLSRGWLAATALGAAGVYQCLLLAPLAIGFAVPALWFGTGFFVWGGLLGFLVMAWVVQPARAQPPAELPRAEAPALYEFVEALAQQLDAPAPQAITLDDALNAGALELNRGLSLRRTRRVLVLGRPLLALLDRPALAAVVAHELAHFSHQHGRLGHWLYRTRAAWLDYAHGVSGDDSSPWERAGLAFARLFVPWFERASFAQSRADEFQADALAARACGGAALGRALQQLDAAGAAWPGLTARLRAQWQREHAEPPADLMDRLGAELRQATNAATVAPDRPARGTHPPTPARLQALGVAPAAVTWDAAPAGPELLGPRWALEAGGPDRAGAAARYAWGCWHRLYQRWAPPEAGPEPEGPAPVWREKTLESFREAWQAGRFTPAPASDRARDALAHALQGHPVLRAAWCLALEVPREGKPPHRGCMLILRASPQAMEAEGVDEGALMGLAADLVAELCGPAVLPLPRVRYTSESVPEEVAARPDTLLFGS